MLNLVALLCKVADHTREVNLTQILKPGIHLDVPEILYHADPCASPSLSNGTAHRLVTQSALHAKTHHPRLWDAPPAEDDSTEATDRGALAHAMVLGGLDRVVAVDPTQFPGKKGGIPEGWTNDNIRAERDRIRALKKIPVLSDKFFKARTMAERALEAIAECEVPEVQTIMQPDKGDSEVTIVWQHGKILCRARPDRWSKDRSLMLEYKTTGGLAEPDHWIRRQLSPMGYDMQATHYRDGGETLTDRKIRHIFLVQEAFEPYACSFVELDEAHREVAEHRMDLARALWASHLASGKWPGYGNRVHYASPPTWAIENAEISLERRLELGAQG